MFRADQPINTHKEDLLGRHSFAKARADSMLSYELDDSISVGLFGKWGSGKTSIINMTLEEIKSSPVKKEPFIIKFNPWNFSDQNQLVQQFFKELSLVLCRKDSAGRHIKIGRAIQKYSRFFEPLDYVPTVSFIGKLAKGLKGVGQATEQAGKDGLKNLGALKNEIDTLLRKLDTKIIIVIDDIDRLNNTEIRQIFQLVKSLADFPNTIYLLSFDKEVVINALKKVQEGPGNDYLEKVIQVPFEIPQISKNEVEHFLFNKLDELIKDIPENRWDQTYWGNVYHSGLKYLFHTIRDVNRYLNTLSFGFSLIKDEVNPIDFIAITAIQVFIPGLYKNIRENKELFSGIKDSYRGSESSQKEQETRIENILEPVDIIPREILTDFLQRLFPKMENVGYSHGFLESWRKQGRICSPDLFDTYFKLFIPKDEISLREIERILSTGNNEETFSNELLKLIQENKILRFLERMEDYTNEDIPEENIAPIINALMDVGDLFPEGRGGFFAIKTPMRILRLFYQLSHRYDEHDQRFKLFVNAINYSNRSLYTVVHEVGVQCQQHGKYGSKEKPEPPEKTTVNNEQLDELVKLAANKIYEWAKSGRLEGHNNLLSILFMWRHWNGKDNLKKFVKTQTGCDKGLAQFIKHFLSDVRSHGLSDYVERVSWRISLESVEKFLCLEEVDSRLRKIKASAQFDELEEKEQLAINTFLDTRDGKVKDLSEF
ncbi:MAG: P-loop NTPase fold protein [Thermotogota bacterium]|nr:P-loop NTPase fold protein [Thermotogota bacterium]